MSQYQRILLIADPSMRRTPAFERAAWLAGRSGAMLHIAVFAHNAVIAAAALLDRDGALQARKAWTEIRRRWLSEQTAALIADGRVVTADVVWARPTHEEMLLHIADQSPDLVLKDVQHESRLSRVRLTPLDWQLLRTCPAPLLLVNSAADAPPRRVLAAVDASHAPAGARDLNDSIIREAVALAAHSGAELHLLYAYAGPHPLVDPMGAGLGTIAELYRALLPIHQKNFDALAKAHSVPAARRHFLHGPAVQTLCDFAAADHGDVLVIGSIRHGVIDRLLMGSTAEAILDRLPCSVLGVKP